MCRAKRRHEVNQRQKKGTDLFFMQYFKWLSLFGLSGGAVTVGRWMSREEFDTMLKTGKVQESRSGTTHVAYPSDPEAYKKQAHSGSLYVEFDVPKLSVKPTQQGWAKILGPQTIEGRLASKKGLPIPQLPEAVNIRHKEIKR